MAISKKIILELIDDLPEEKLGKVLSYINFIKKEEEPTLLLEAEDEEEIINILEENEWYTSDTVSDMLKQR